MTLDADKPAQTDDDIWLEAAERLKLCAESEGDNRTRGIESLKFRWGDQWPETARNERETDQRPCLTVNHTDVACQRLENQLRQQRPRIKVHPTGDTTIDKAKRVNGLTRAIETRSNASVAYDAGVSMAKDIGWGYWRINTEYEDARSFNQELLIKPIFNPFTVYMDPSAVMPAGEDQGWCLISETMKRQEYKRRYPNAANVDYSFVEAPGDHVLDWESRTDVRLAEYFRKFEKRDTLIQLSDGSLWLESDLSKKGPEIAAVLQAMQLSVNNHRTTYTCQIEWYRLNGRKVVDRRMLPGKYIPIIRCQGNRLDLNGKILRKGMIENLKDPARMYNYWDTAFTERLALSPKAPWVAAEGTTEGHPEWNDANRRSYSTLVYKPALGPDGATALPPPTRQPPAQIESGFMEAMDRAERDLMTVAGVPADDPAIRARIVSGDKHLQRRQGMQDLTHFQYYDNQTYAIMWTGIVLLDLIPHYYDTQRTLRIIGEDGVPQLVTVNERDENGQVKPDSNLKVGSYDVVMDTGPGYATKREEAAENMLQLLGTPLGEVVVATGPDIVLRNMDFHGADELADRAAVATPGGMEKIVEGLPKQAQNVIGALQTKLQQSEQTIQQLQLEIKYKSGIQQQKNDADETRNVRDNTTRLVIADKQIDKDLQVQDSKAATARDVAEIHGATQLLNTKAESAHEERQSDKLIAQGTQDR